MEKAIAVKWIEELAGSKSTFPSATCCVNFGKTCDLSETLFLHLWNGDNTTCHISYHVYYIRKCFDGLGL